MSDVDVVILGGGSAGYACALRAEQLGLSVALIEADKLGGTCLHRGCIPTKALLHTAEVADLVRDSARVGVGSTFSGVDAAAALHFQRTVVAGLYSGLKGLMNRPGIETVYGRGHLVGPSTVQVADRLITGSSVVLATGASPRAIPGVDVGPRILTSDTALTLDRVPESVIVLGGGAIGTEFASLWRSFGASVTLVEAFDRILPGEDEWSSQQISTALTRRGIDIRVGTKAEAVHASSEAVTVDLSSGERFVTDVVLMAAGRQPQTDGMGLAARGVDVVNGFVTVDENLRTSASGIYAIGDIVAGYQLAHRGFQHGTFVAEHIAGLHPARVHDDLIPRVTYSHPQVASVGLTEKAAKDRHGAVTSAVFDLAGNAKSRILNTSGGVKVIRSGVDGPVAGVHIVGDRAGELIGEAQLAVAWEALPEDVGAFVHAHPTQGEALGEAMLALLGRPLHSHT